MCDGGGSPSPPESPTYRARDGRTFDNPQEAAEWDRRLALADAFGYEGDAILPQPIFETETITLRPGDEGYADQAGPQFVTEGRGDNAYRVSNPDYGSSITTERQVKVGETSGLRSYLEEQDLIDDFEEYWNQGLTAGDYRRDQRLAEEEEEREAEEEERERDRLIEEREREAEIAARERAISENRSAIQDRFANNFGPDYFASMRDSTTDYYMPQIRDQYTDARENVVFDLARKGTLDSSMAGDQFGDLNQRYEQQKADVANRAQDMVNSAKDRVAQSKSQLLNYTNSFNQSTADPTQISSQINTQLTNSLDRIQAQAPQPTPLGQVFADYATPTLTSLAKVGGAAAKEYGPTLFGSSSGSGYNVVR